MVPSVVLLRDDGELIVGEAAERRAATEPERVAREFKRRIGDPTPVLLAGTPVSADALTARLLRWAVDKVAEAEGGPAAGIAVSHPANWRAFKQDLLRQVIRQADLDDARTLSEPEAAAIHYASQERVAPGSAASADVSTRQRRLRDVDAELERIEGLRRKALDLSPDPAGAARA